MRQAFGHIRIPLQRIHIELTNICNFDCAFCPKSVMKRPYGYMDTQVAKRLISEIVSSRLSTKITFHLMGEPTLHPDFFDILDHSLAEGAKIGLTTNGSTLGSRIGSRLLDYDLHQMDVSLQTPDEASFALRRSRSLAFSSYLENPLSFFCLYHERHPNSIFKFRMMNTIFGREAMERKTGAIEVISSGKQLRKVITGYAELLYGLMNKDLPAGNLLHSRIRSIIPYRWNVVEVMPNVFFETYVLDGWGHAFEGEIREAWAGYCFGMKDHFAVLYNGDVVLCCLDYDGRTRIGNVSHAALKEVLSCEELREIMQGFERYRLVHPYCRRCQGSSSMASWSIKPFLSVLSLKVLKPLFYTHTKLYE